MTIRPYIVQWGTRNEEKLRTLERYAEAYGCDIRHFNQNEVLAQRAGEMKHARMAFVWNGMQAHAPLVHSMMQQRGIPVVFFEFGIPHAGYKQRQTMMYDLSGFCGSSFLNRPLHWVVEDDYDRLNAERIRRRQECPRRDDGYILILLQIQNDTQVVHHSPFDSMQDFVEFVITRFPDDRFRIRVHPMAGEQRRPYMRFESDRIRITTAADTTLDEDIAGCVSAIGISSTALYEAAIYGVPVLALGDHPLRTHMRDQERCAAAALAMTLPINGDGLTSMLERHGVRPLGCRPLTEAYCV